MKYSFPKEEKLKRKKIIEQLFIQRKGLTHYPLRVLFLETALPENVPIQAGVSVSKRRFRKAVTRIRIKRLMRESYRLHKNHVFNNITTTYACMFLYIGKHEPNFDEISQAMQTLLEKFVTKVKDVNS